MYSVGIDSGSVATKGVLFDGENFEYIILPTGWSPKNACTEALNSLLSKANLKREDVFIVSTGYGRVSIDFADKDITEITCHGKGAHYLNSDVRTILDIGGQDSKVIKLDRDGNLADFLMNDKCAAGTGRFLEVMSNLLGSDISDIDSLTKGATPENINSMCTVFAESEVISLLASGSTKESVACGILHSIANRIANLANKMGVEEGIAFTGGLAKSKELTNIISEKLGNKKIYTSPYSQYNGAIGAAVIGQDMLRRKRR
ncbi:putative CoA-substrate-specific enzyme activase [Gottschalkia acidurici 9a]|uniref:CoA-substrate-specific enzyme activase n=1 Tax=Gottschalkia acidurici (strain ATCC 7906 / DSM 604 / BCRC 14475 / CIP 104303 / KCTC 5404 / NCIMB 10678 / 9a) TaxID=1128398 RepID=K0AXP1_GOTA9|nr:acyl-CoA dehydratase activase [Gottschalkia acidurici]AFS77505.1 putative CoA-substrate-specific enzyme activase [Gottschalkia acidurici 9a]